MPHFKTHQVGCLKSQTNRQTMRERQRFWGGEGATYLPPLLVLHPLSIHDTYCGERRKTGLRPWAKKKVGAPDRGVLDGEAPQETLAWVALLGLELGGGGQLREGGLEHRHVWERHSPGGGQRPFTSRPEHDGRHMED